MFKFFIPFLILLFFSCSTYRTRRPIHKTEIVFKGGNYRDMDWSEELKFKRVSWYKDATLSHEILITSLTGESKFSNWMGTDKLHLTRCTDFKIALLYADINAKQGISFLKSQLKNSGYEEISLLNFSHEIKAHQNYGDWKLGRHKFIGLCLENAAKNNIDISIPGFKKYTL